MGAGGGRRCAGVGLATLGYAAAVEPRRLQQVRYRLGVPDLPAALEGARIAHLTAFHVGIAGTRRSTLWRAVGAARVWREVDAPVSWWSSERWRPQALTQRGGRSFPCSQTQEARGGLLKELGRGSGLLPNISYETHPLTGYVKQTGPGYSYPVGVPLAKTGYADGSGPYLRSRRANIASVSAPTATRAACSRARISAAVRTGDHGPPSRPRTR